MECRHSHRRYRGEPSSSRAGGNAGNPARAHSQWKLPGISHSGRIPDACRRPAWPELRDGHGAAAALNASTALEWKCEESLGYCGVVEKTRAACGVDPSPGAPGSLGRISSREPPSHPGLGAWLLATGSYGRAPSGIDAPSAFCATPPRCGKDGDTDCGRAARRQPGSHDAGGSKPAREGPCQTTATPRCIPSQWPPLLRPSRLDRTTWKSWKTPCHRRHHRPCSGNQLFGSVRDSHLDQLRRRPIPAHAPLR